MNISLIDVPRLAFPWNQASNVVIPPLGVAYIAAAIEAEGHCLQVIDSVGEAMTQCEPLGTLYLRGLNTIIMTGFAAFYSLYFLVKPVRLWHLIKGLRSLRTETKAIRSARSIFIELRRIRLTRQQLLASA